MLLIKKNHVVRLVAALLALGAAQLVWGQDNVNYQWSKSVRSLTVFKPGDAVRIQILELYSQEKREHFLNADYPINPEGYIVIPLIGEVKVKGYTVYEVMQSIKERLSEHIENPYVYVRPLIRVTVMGEFSKPGAYHVDPAASLWSVIERAGGPTSRINIDKMHVRRGGKVVIESVLRAFEKGVSLEEVGIESGDQIMGPSKSGLSVTFIMQVVNVFATIVLLYMRLNDQAW